MADLNKLFADLLEVSQGNVDALSRATKEFARDVTAEPSRLPRESSALPPSPPAAETPQAE